MSITSATADRSVSTALNQSQGLDATEQASLKGLTGDDLTRARAQLEMQKRTEMIAFISNILKMRHEQAMSTINNLR